MKRARFRTDQAGVGDQLCQPCGKTAFATRKRAEQISRSQNLRYYQCPEGNGFHLGHLSNTPTHAKGIAAMRSRKRATDGPFEGSFEELQELARRMREGNQE